MGILGVRTVVHSLCAADVAPAHEWPSLYGLLGVDGACLSRARDRLAG